MTPMMMYHSDAWSWANIISQFEWMIWICRVVKEKLMYEKEVETEKLRYEKMKIENPNDYDLKKQVHWFINKIYF